MVLRLLLLGSAGLFVAFGSLTTFRVPVAVNWRFALLAGEYGHWLAGLPMVVGLLAWWGRAGAPGLAWTTMLLSACAAGFLLKPAAQAFGVAARLREEFPSEWMARAPARPVVSIGTLYGGRTPEPVPFETHTFAPGLAMDVYRPPGVEERAPCVVMVHGGGWDGGDRSQLSRLNHWLARRGYGVAAISYRLAPHHRWPAQREDTLAAIAYVKAHADTLGLDPERLVLCGRSAGGQIAAAVGYTAQDRAIRGVIALYAPHDMRFVWSIARDDDALNSFKLMTQFLGGPPSVDRAAVYDSASAQANVRHGITPPTLLIHGAIDTLVWHRHSERLAARLAEARVLHGFVSLPWAVHALEYNLNGPSGQLTTYALETFLAATTAVRTGSDKRAE